MPLKNPRARKAAKQNCCGRKGFCNQTVKTNEFLESEDGVEEDQHIVDPNIFSSSELALCESTERAAWKEIMGRMGDGTSRDYSDRNLFADGSSKRTERYHRSNKAKLVESAKSTKKISSYYSPIEMDHTAHILGSDVEDNIADFVSEEDADFVEDEIVKWKTALHNLVSSNAKICKNSRTEMDRLQGGSFQYLQYLAIAKYFELLISGQSKMAASDTSARAIFQSGYSYKARCIRNWATHYLLHETVPLFQQGKHSKTFSIIQDELVCSKMRNYLRSQKGNDRTPENFLQYLNNGGLRELHEYAPDQVSLETVRRWMIYLGFHAAQHSKGYYVDGHERNDVVEHRIRYLTQLEEIESRARTFEGPEMETEIDPVLAEGKRRAVVIVHDESCYNSNDSNSIVWVEAGRHELKPKSRGRCLMVSGFMCDCHGFLNLGGDRKSYKIIAPGKNADGYWTNEDLVKQLESVIPLFEETHIDCDLYFIFDNSQNHHARRPDGLSANALNLADGGSPLLSVIDKAHCSVVHF